MVPGAHSYGAALAGRSRAGNTTVPIRDERGRERSEQGGMPVTVLSDLRVPPSHRLEALRGDRSGQHSIRINNQWRVCFTWTDQGAMEIEVVDYH